MLGREAYQNPFILHSVDSLLFNEEADNKTRLDYLQAYLPYVEAQLRLGVPMQHMSRHILGLFKGEKGGKQYRRHLSENCHRKDAGVEVLHDAMNLVA